MIQLEESIWNKKFALRWMAHREIELISEYQVDLTQRYKSPKGDQHSTAPTKSQSMSQTYQFPISALQSTQQKQQEQAL